MIPKAFDPQEVIRLHLEAASARAMPCVINSASIQFLKARTLPGHHFYSVTFQSTEGQPYSFTFFLKQQPDALWYIKFATGGKKPHEPAEVDVPSVHLQVGESSLREVLVGGEVFDQGFDIEKVRLVSPNGRILEDRVHDGLVLFWTNQRLILPLQAELMNSSGEVVRRQTVLAFPALLP